MIVRELSYILNRVPGNGDVKFWVDGKEEHGLKELSKVE